MPRANTAKAFERVTQTDPAVALARLEGSLRAMAEHCGRHLNDARGSLERAGRNGFEDFARELDNATKSVECARMFHAEWRSIMAELKR